MLKRRFFVQSLLPAVALSLVSKPVHALIDAQFHKHVVCADQFKLLVGEHLTVKSQSGRNVRLRLEEVTQHTLKGNNIPEHIRTDPFSCLWKIDSDEIEEGEVYLKHPQLGLMSLHLIPKWEEDGVRLYESIWN